MIFSNVRILLQLLNSDSKFLECPNRKVKYNLFFFLGYSILQLFQKSFMRTMEVLKDFLVNKEREFAEIPGISRYSPPGWEIPINSLAFNL